MSDSRVEMAGDRIIAFLNYLFMFGLMAVIAAILTAAMVFQYAYGELPCPLCLLERLALFGIAFGLMQQFRHGFSYQNTGVALLFALLLVIVAERQTLLDIYPRPGHAYVGSAVFGLHMPVWSVIIGLAVLFALAAKLAILGGDRDLERHRAAEFPLLDRLATAVALYLILLCLINLSSVILQCGFGECHTFGYRLLGGAAELPS